MKDLVIIGAGGLAREAHDLAYKCFGSIPGFRVKGFLSDGPSNIERMGYPKVLGKVAEYKPQSNDAFFCAIGNVFDKRKTVGIISDKGCEFVNLIHPSAIISPSVILGIGVAVKAFCILSNDVTIGDFTYLQSSVIMGHDVRIGKFCQINSFSFFAGNCIVGDLVNINAGARLIQEIIVEDESIVGMGSVVLRRVKRGTTVFGNPATEVKF